MAQLLERRTSKVAGLSVALTICLGTLSGTAVAKTDLPSGIKQGPSGLAFYTPPNSTASGTHGSVIWARKLTNDAALPAAGHNYLVLYWSVTAAGKKVAVSGTLALPKGKPPRGGWPLVSWAHGTTGVADVCAPSRNSATFPEHTGLETANTLLKGWVKRGYAVAQTDYQGLGTPGPHAYLIGRPEARAVIDMARAAHRLTPTLTRKWLAMGHSQGGHATLYSTRYAKGWAPELPLAGAIALAPASHLPEQAQVLVKLTGTLPFAGIVSIVVRGAQAAGYEGTDQLLSDLAVSKLPLTESLCLSALDDALSTLQVQDTFRPTASLGSFLAILTANDPDSLKLKTPVLILQGTADTTVLPAFTDQLVTSLKANGASVTYDKFEGKTHGTVLAASQSDALKWAESRFK